MTVDGNGFPSSAYAKTEVRKAGQLLAQELIWSAESAPAIKEAFAIANSWRDSHAFPMRSIRYHVLHCMRHLGIHGLSAARLKRMKAIRMKLGRSPVTLDKLQDLGGCRFILPTIADVHALTDTLRTKVPHILRSERNYISEPKPDGYRSQHLMFTYVGRKGRIIHDGCRIEVQVRTRLQHSWATTVESVGLFRGEQLKNHQGSGEWLRLFELMSWEFAEAERCLVSDTVPRQIQRCQEISDLAKSLDALGVLESVSLGFRETDFPLAPGYRPSHYLIRYNHTDKTVRVEPYNAATAATQSYDIAEHLDNMTGNTTLTVVLVEVDKLDSLKAAYPNYFGDVELFTSQLRLVVQGKAASEYAIAERQPRQPNTERRIDLSWLKGGRYPGARLDDRKTRRS